MLDVLEFPLNFEQFDNSKTIDNVVEPVVPTTMLTPSTKSLGVSSREVTASNHASPVRLIVCRSTAVFKPRETVNPC
jgi:hypothetical protein